MNPMPTEIIDSVELARRWNVPVSWIRSKVQSSRTSRTDQIPHVQFGRYVRFEWGSVSLEAWLEEQRHGARKATHRGGGPMLLSAERK